MKKTLFIFILLLTAIGVNAQSKTRGGDNKIDASTVSQITFNGDNVTIKYNDGTSATFDMETVTIDFSKVTSIGERAFKDCKKLSQIVLPNSIEEVGVACFWGCCSLKEIYLIDLFDFSDIHLRIYQYSLFFGFQGNLFFELKFHVLF